MMVAGSLIVDDVLVPGLSPGSSVGSVIWSPRPCDGVSSDSLDLTDLRKSAQAYCGEDG